ncbi:MAG TPA: nucleotidyltransferase family protein [Bryobacteraceae bacterium]|nr:nucleotidyltransferase family protein [Bryobacteraceae bacterium]
MPPKVPAWALALFEALRFTNPDSARLRSLSASEWHQLLKFCDAAQLTLLLGYICQEHLPAWVRGRISRDRANYSRRFATLQARVCEIAAAFEDSSIPFVLLKGFAQADLFTPDPMLRAQGDIDIWCLPESIDRASQTLRALGYRPFGKSRGRHLAPMIRETHWDWRGDHFAADLPIPVDLHYRLWDSEMERFSGPDESELWSRRAVSPDAQGVPVLGDADIVAFSAFHLLMHLLHGDLRLQRAWEIAFFLENHSTDENFWNRWAGSYAPSVLSTQVIVFVLIRLWFECKLPRCVSNLAKELPGEVILWIERFGFSPVANLFTPNKDEVWLNLCLLKTRRDRVRVALRRFIPLNSTTLPTNQVRTDASFPAFILRRALYHGRLLLPACWSAIRWQCLRIFA